MLARKKVEGWYIYIHQMCNCSVCLIRFYLTFFTFFYFFFILAARIAVPVPIVSALRAIRFYILPLTDHFRVRIPDEPGRRHHTATQTATYRTAKVEKRIDYSDGPILSTSPITRNGNLDMPLAIPLEAINWCRVNENRMTLLQKFFILNQGAFYQYTSFFFSIPTIIFFCYFASSSSFVCSFFSCILQQPLDNLTKCRNSLVVPISTC